MLLSAWPLQSGQSFGGLCLMWYLSQRLQRLHLYIGPHEQHCCPPGVGRVCTLCFTLHRSQSCSMSLSPPPAEAHVFTCGPKLQLPGCDYLHGALTTTCHCAA